jgi:RNA polymerase sigma-70 factor, ECF subfamily
VGPWLPEPILTSDDERPDTVLQRDESITLAFLVLLETLSAEERAVFLLKEIFEYSHDEIARMLETSAANSRQILHRAKARIAEGRPRRATDEAAKRELARRFVAAFTSGDAGALENLLAEDVRFVSDGGGKVTAARRPLVGRDEVLHMLTGIHRTAMVQGLLPDVSIEPIDVNFNPAFIIRRSGRIDSVYALDIAGDRIQALHIVRNPDKLRFIERQLYVTSVRGTSLT